MREHIPPQYHSVVLQCTTNLQSCQTSHVFLTNYILVEYYDQDISYAQAPILLRHGVVNNMFLHVHSMT